MLQYRGLASLPVMYTSTEYEAFSCRGVWRCVTDFFGTLTNKTNKQTFKVRQPQRAARSKRPNTPSDGSKNNGFHTTSQEKYPSIQPTNHQEDLSVSKSNTIQSTNQARCPVSPPHLYHPRCPAHQPRRIPKHVSSYTSTSSSSDEVPGRSVSDSESNISKY